MTTHIRDTWLSHPEYWIATGPQQAKVDRILYDSFSDINPLLEDIFGQIIYLDQLLRHFSRIEPLEEDFIYSCRETAAKLVTCLGTTVLMAATEAELIWYLMPWKHLGNWEPVFRTVEAWLKGASLTTVPHLNRFFMDSYKKAYTVEHVAKTLQLAPSIEAEYTAKAICESHPPLYSDTTAWLSLPLPPTAKALLTALLSKGSVTISLSGGVDSMLMAALLKRKGVDIVAVHIVYGNRAESIQEQAFVTTYCAKLSIPLYLYRVEWLRRDTSERAFYEEMTRHLRFSAYKALGRPVLLGHIQEDAIENVWTNFAKGTHLEDLVKFQPVAVEDGVTICRPWLSIKKQTIYTVADALAIPHLKNTTPTWSNRGKFRTEFYKATHTQYGEHVDEKVLEVAGRLKEQATLLDRILYKPIRDSWNPETKELNVTLAVQNEVGVEGWHQLLTHVAHTHLGIPKPRFVATQDFVGRLQKGGLHGQRCSLRKDFTFTIRKNKTDTWLQF